MAFAEINGVQLHYETYGTQGPWLTLAPGARRSAQEWVSLAQQLAQEGFRVLLHDRRNTGASGWRMEEGRGEEEVWADDWLALATSLGIGQAFWGGGSSGARLAMMVGQRCPHKVLGLLLVRITGGAFTASRLPHTYYGQYIEAARHGGMQAVCALPFFEAYTQDKPEVRSALLAMDVDRYIAIVEHWREVFLQGPREPVLGMAHEDLRNLHLPVWIVPGNDNTHVAHHAREAAAMLPDARLFELPLVPQDVPAVPFSDWRPHEPLLVRGMIAFMREVLQQRGPDRQPLQTPLQKET